MASIDIPAPMAGAIKEVLVALGARVAAGQELVVIESMKMEIPVEAESGGTVSRIDAPEGTVVDDGAAIMTVA